MIYTAVKKSILHLAEWQAELTLFIISLDVSEESLKASA